MSPRKLASLLVEAKLISRLAIDAALAKLPPGESLADHLVRKGSLTEADLLRAVAQATNTRFVSTARLQSVTISDALLAFVPHEAATRLQVAPLAFDKTSKSLALVMADPGRLKELDELPDVARMETVVGHVALPSAVRAMIKRVYAPTRVKTDGLDLEVPSGTCTQCRAPYFEGQLDCAQCGLLLNLNELGEPPEGSDPRVVRALLSVPTGNHRIPTRAQVLEGPTRRGPAVSVDEAQVVKLRAGVEVFRTLSELEAFVVGELEAGTTVAKVIERSGLSPVEAKAVLASLSQRAVVELLAPPAAQEPGPGNKAPMGSGQVPALRGARLGNDGVSVDRTQIENSLQLALNLEARGEIEGALKVLRIAITRTKRPAPLFNRLALVLAGSRRDFKEAEALLHQAIKLEPENPVYQANLAKVIMVSATKLKKR